ncbi:MAG: hypothetical protein AB8B84_16490 [Granulosicoccus sp.]
MANALLVIRNTTAATILLLILSSCAETTTDSCDDIIGTITHSVVEITDIESALPLKRNTSENTLEAIDQVTGTDFSNLLVDIQLSWNEEQHRFRAPSTFIQSALDWLIAPAYACTLQPYYIDYQPVVTSIQIYSDADFNGEYIAGYDLSPLFTTSLVNNAGYESLSEAQGNGKVLSERTYSLYPARIEGNLVAIPTTPTIHSFTILLALDDGRVHEFRTSSFLLSGT